MRRTVEASLLAALILLWLVPVATSVEESDIEKRIDLCVISYRPSADFGTLLVEADLDKTDDELDALMRDVDSNDDEMITRDEVVAYEDASAWSESDASNLGKYYLTVDGRDPMQVEFRTDLTNFEGSIHSGQTRLVTEHRTYRFETQNGTSHELRGGLYPYPTSRVVIEFVVLEAPLGWLVASVNGTEFKEERVELAAFDTESPFVVVFTARPPEEPRGLPGPALIPFLVALAILVHHRRHKR